MLKRSREGKDKTQICGALST